VPSDQPTDRTLDEFTSRRLTRAPFATTYADLVCR
jgi:hypothetical protein